MKIEDIKRICVVGAGNMGHQISLCAVLAGYQVKCYDVNPDVLVKANTSSHKYLADRVSKGKLTQEQADQALAKLMFTQSIGEAVSDADFVIEAAIEMLEVKRQLFKEIDSLVPTHTILATNSSTLVSSLIADVTRRPEKVCNMHFFNPVLVMKLVEVVQGPHTSDETAAITMELCSKLGKICILLKKEIQGFLVNRILRALAQEALYLSDMKVATPKDIDLAVENALGHPMGPFRLMDLTGIDVSYHISMERYRASGDPKDKPSPIIVEKFCRKEWGKKTKRGFYIY